MSMILNLLSLMLVSTNDFKNETVLRLQLYNLPANTNFYRILPYHRVSLSLKSRETSLRLTLKYSFFRKLFKRLSRFRKLLLWQFICFIRKLCCLYPSNKSPIIYLPHFTFDSMFFFKKAKHCFTYSFLVSQIKFSGIFQSIF